MAASSRKASAIDYQQAYMALEAELCDLRHAASICVQFAMDIDEATVKAKSDPAATLKGWIDAEEQAIDHLVFVSRLTSRLAGDVFDKYFDAMDPDSKPAPQVQS